MLSELLLRQLAVTLHARALTSPQVRPTDEPVIRSGDPDAVRVLLLGSGVTSGWGVHTHGLALVGQLQKVLQAGSNRPVDVEQISEAGATLSQAVEMLGDRATEDWDAIVVAFGLSDAMRLTPTREWAQALDRLLAKLDGDMPQGLLVPIVVAGMAPTETMGLMTPLASIFRRQPDRLNAVTARAVQRNRRTAFAPLPAMADSATSPQGSSEAYRVWAGAIAAHLLPLLPRDVVRVSEQRAAREARSPSAAAAFDPCNAPVRSGLIQVAERLRSEADADLVLIGLLDGDRFWTVADSTGRTGHSLLLPASFCATTVSEGFLHVQDAAHDPRLSHLSAAMTRQFDSYAGVALHDSTGQEVGAICMFNGAAGARLDQAVLERVGREAEAQLALLRAAADEPVFIARLDPPEDALRVLPAALSAAEPEGGPSAGAYTPERRGRSSSIPGALGRRIRLSTEGRDLTKIARRRSVPEERDLRIQGPDAIRVLLVGGDYAVGFGTTDRHDALDGAVARLLHIRTGRGVIVENRSRHQVPLEQLAGSLGPAGAHTFDLVIWTPTFVEAARLLLRTRWVAGVGLMLRRIQTTSDAAVVLVGVPALLGVQPIAAIGRARAAQINRLLGHVAARHDRVHVVHPPSIVLKDVEVMAGAEVYRAVAVQLLPAIMQLLGGEDRDLETPSPRSTAPRPRLAPAPA